LAREEKLVRPLAARRTATLDDVLPDVYDDVPKFMHVYARYSLLAHAVKLVEEERAHVEGEIYRWRGD
jgi:hydroxyacylglutathione hydrolase